MHRNEQNHVEFDRFLKTINLKNVKNEFYKEREKKFHQIVEYAKQVSALLKKMSKKRTLTFVDCGAGSCYLSFYLNYIFRDSKINFICIDYNHKVIQRAGETAISLGYTNMQFICADIVTYDIAVKPDLVYSLHACDTATDMSVYTGIKSRARHILSVSCCQRYTYGQMNGHPLTQVTKHKIYKERLTDMIGDTMRSLILEYCGFDTDIFEFSSSRHTDKNVMMRAVKIPASDKRKNAALGEYRRLKNLFNMEPKLIEFMSLDSESAELLLDVS